MKEPIIQITDDGLYLTFGEYKRMKNSIPFTFKNYRDEYVTVSNVIKHKIFLRRLKLRKINEN